MPFECRILHNERYMVFSEPLIKQKSWSLCTNVYLISHYIKDINYRSRKSLGTLFLYTENISYTQKKFRQKKLNSDNVLSCVLFILILQKTWPCNLKYLRFISWKLNIFNIFPFDSILAQNFYFLVLFVRKSMDK